MIEFYELIMAICIEMGSQKSNPSSDKLEFMLSKEKENDSVEMSLSSDDDPEIFERYVELTNKSSLELEDYLVGSDMDENQLIDAIRSISSTEISDKDETKSDKFSNRRNS